jgi:hypothetical protein
MDFLNTIQLNVRAFFFNAKTDYLPYYKNFSFQIDKSDNQTPLKQLLAMIQEQNSDFAYPQKDLLFRVNGLIVTGEEKLSSVIDELGNELTIDAALNFRSDNGLIFNNNDFMQQFRRVFKRHEENKEDLLYYLSLYPVHYASETFNYNRNYIGDAILITAAHIIEKYPEYEKEILTAINDEFDGISCCEYENNVFQGKDYSEVIQSLKEKIQMTNSPRLIDKLKSDCLNKMRRPINIESLEQRSVALYLGDKNSQKISEQLQETIEMLGGKFIEFEMSTKRAGQSIIESNSTIAYQKAGKMMLEALDNGAEILVFAKEEDATLFNRIVADVEHEVGRPISLALLSLSKFHEMSNRVEA